MKKILFALSMLCISPALLAKHNEDKKCRKTCKATPISCPTKIKKSGCYCLTRDITGVIEIASNDVTLDLNCHEVKGNGADPAIIADGVCNVAVKNGSVRCCGILFNNSDSVNLSDITFSECTTIAAQLIDTSGINISGCDFKENNRALLLEGCRNGKVICCNIYDNLTTTDSIVRVAFCDDIVFQDTNISQNTSNIPGVVSGDPREGITAVDSSCNISFDRMKFNKNTSLQEETALGSLFFVLSNHCSVSNTEVNQNTINRGNLECISTCVSPNFQVSNVTSNENFIPNGNQSSSICNLLLFLGTDNRVSDFTSNGNILLGDETLPDGAAILSIFPVFADNSEFTRLQLNDNQTDAEYFGIPVVGNNFSITHSQSSNNFGANQVAGFGALLGQNCVMSDCQSSNNLSLGVLDNGSSPEQALARGFQIFGDHAGVTLTRIEASNNVNMDGAAAGVMVAPIFTPDGGIARPGGRDVTIESAVTHNNRSVTGEACGILIEQSESVVVSNSQAFDTSSESTNPDHIVAGITARDSFNVCITNTEVHGTTSTGDAMATGVALINQSGGNLGNVITRGSRSNVLPNPEAAEKPHKKSCDKAIGVLLSGTTSEVSVNDSQAVDCQDIGFADKTKCKNFFYGNYAEKNKKDYAGVPGRIITFDKKKGTFSKEPNRWSNVRVCTKCKTDKR